jgi:hypothetical protein
MVAEERTCCAFLSFELHEHPDELLLTISAPEAARDVADELFGHFIAANSEVAWAWLNGCVRR